MAACARVGAAADTAAAAIIRATTVHPVSAAVDVAAVAAAATGSARSSRA